MKDSETDNKESHDVVKIYEDYKKKEKNIILSVFTI